MPDTRTPASRVRTATVRAWAKDNGWPGLPARGRIPADAQQAFEAEHGRPVDLEDEDVSAIDDDADLDEEPGDDGGEVLDGEVLPPPADLDEARERVGSRQGSAHLRKGRRGRQERKPSEPAPKVTPAV